MNPPAHLLTAFGTGASLPRPICRLGLATFGNTGIAPEDVLHAIDRGVNFLNWCGVPDGLSEAIANLGRAASRGGGLRAVRGAHGGRRPD